MTRDDFRRIIDAADLGALADEDQPIGEAINQVFGAAWGHHSPWMRDLEINDRFGDDLKDALDRLNEAYDENGYVVDAPAAHKATSVVCDTLERIAMALEAATTRQ